jgi:hypothetical protein
MATLEQQLAELEQKTARLKDRIKKQDTAEKVVIGGMMLAYARKHPANAKRLLDIMHKYHEVRTYENSDIITQATLSQVFKFGRRSPLQPPQNR